MQSLPQKAVLVAFSVFVSVLTASLVAQTEPSSALLRSVKVVATSDGSAIEIIGTRPLKPIITPLDKPGRLVIDLPKTYVSLPQKIRLQNERLRSLRINQFQKDPPVARIVADLLQPSGYSWDAAGNRLMVRLRPPASEPTITSGPKVIHPSHTNDAIILDQAVLGGGSSITAGTEATTLRLTHGGEIRVCPGTTVSLTYSQKGHDMMLGMSTGALEAHYSLPASADSVVTPDFRIMLPGPGEFHYGISADSRGNTCVRALPGNSASVVVTELMSDGTYQVKPSERVTFGSGRLKTVAATTAESCGCPPSSAPLPSSDTADVQVSVEVPFVFRASESTPPSIPTDLGKLNLQRIQPFEIAAQPPRPNGFFRKVKGFFAAVFR